MNRRVFLGAAAALAALPASDTVTTATTETTATTADNDRPATRECAVCGEEKPVEMVERTTVQSIGPHEADICRACQHVQNHDMGADRCLQCGQEVGQDQGFAIDLAFPLGVAALPGKLEGQLCGDCANQVATEIISNGLDADEDARKKLVAIADEETERLAALKGT